MMLKIQVIAGSTRENRKGFKVAQWVFEETKKLLDVEVELLDLQQWDLPMYTEPHPKKAEQFKAKVNEADGYIIVTPEYNHGYPASLKNALDYPYDEWNRKVVGFVGYAKGRGSGIRSVEQLKQVANELHLAVLPEALYVGHINDEEVEWPNTEDFFNELLWWTQALKTAREAPTS